MMNLEKVLSVLVSADVWLAKLTTVIDNTLPKPSKASENFSVSCSLLSIKLFRFLIGSTEIAELKPIIVLHSCLTMENNRSCRLFSKRQSRVIWLKTIKLT